MDPKFQVNLGRLYKMTGDNARARACFEAFLASHGTGEEYRRMVPQVKEELARLQ
jgi:hypothetical protein